MKFEVEAGLFGKGAGYALEYDFANFKWEGSGQNQIRPDASFTSAVVDAGAYAELAGKYEYAFGFQGKAHLDLGKLESSLDLTSNAASHASDWSTGANGYIDTSKFEVADLAVTPTAPSADDTYVKLDMNAKLKLDLLARAGYSYSAGFLGSGGDSKTLVDGNVVNIDVSKTILDLSAGKLAGYDDEFAKFSLGFADVAVKLPSFDFETEAKDGTSPFKSIHVSNDAEAAQFLTTEVDLDQWLLPVGNSFDYGIDLGPLSGSVDVGFFDGKLVGNAALKQDVICTPDVDVTMVSSLGETVKGDLGGKFEFKTPEGEGSFSVTASYAMSLTVTAVTSLLLSTSIDWKALYGEVEAGINVLGLSETWSKGFNVLSGSVPIASTTIKLSESASVYAAGDQTETYTINYEKFVTTASGTQMNLTSHQVSAAGGARSETITGNALGNTISGEGGKDTLRGAGGGDTLNGGAGDDYLDGGSGRDKLVGGDGLDTASYASAGEAIVINLSRLSLNLGDAKGDTFSGIERIVGSSYDDKLAGDAVANTFFGGAGNDRISGGNGADRLAGGAGKDVFVFTSLSNSTAAGSGRDTIIDFTHEDRLDLSAIDVNGKVKGNGAFTWIGTEKFGGKVGELRFEKGRSDTYIYADTNGDKKADFSIHLDDAVMMQKADFLL